MRVACRTGIGGIAQTQEVVDYCTARNIKEDIELICPEDINRALPVRAVWEIG